MAKEKLDTRAAAKAKRTSFSSLPSLRSVGEEEDLSSSPTKNLNSNLKRLAEITEWFDNQEEIDVEEGLKKVKEAVGLIRVSKERLKTIENEFEEIKKGIDPDFVEDAR